MISRRGATPTIKFVSALLILAILVLLKTSFLDARQARVATVVDGDTVRLEDGEAVRLLGIDTPEQDEPLYREAAKFLAAAVEGREVTLEFDQTRRDHYKRLLAYIWIGDTLINQSLVEEGWARVYMWPPDTLHFRSLVAAQREARDENRGIWRLRQPRAESSYVIHPERYRFHRPGCKGIGRRHTGRASDRDSLLAAGYSACRVCRP